MKEDKLKEFIDKHRAEFDDETPPVRVWSSLKKELDKNPQIKFSKKTIVLKIMKVAASVAILLVAGGGAGIYLQQQKYGEAASIKDYSVRNEYMEAQSYFTNQIDEKITELSKYTTDNKLVDELNQIDQISAELKVEILRNPDQDKDLLVKQMIRQYQQKLSTLNKILEKLEVNKTNNQSIPSRFNKTKNDSIQL